MKYLERLKHNSYLYIGYPPATDFKFSQYAELLDYSMNSLGNPYDMGNPFSSHAHEKEVVDFFINMYGLDKDSFWGYVANCSSESILYCLWKARDYLKAYDKPLKVICNDFTHYSADKVAEILNLDLVKVSTNEFGEINYDELNNLIDNDYSYIFLATIGSTMTSSIDNIVKIKQLFKAKSINHYIHADAAFDGAFIPFTDDLEKVHGFDSINISGHKFIGAPMPSGITIIKKKYVSGRHIEYVANSDTTIGGSRNGLVPYLLYKRIKQIGGAKGMKKRYFECLENAAKYSQTLAENGIETFRFDNAITIVLKNIPADVMQKWHAPTKGNITTLTALSKLDSDKLDIFINDIKDYKNGKFSLSKLKTEQPSVVEKL